MPIFLLQCWTLITHFRADMNTESERSAPAQSELFSEYAAVYQAHREMLSPIGIEIIAFEARHRILRAAMFSSALRAVLLSCVCAVALIHVQSHGGLWVAAIILSVVAITLELLEIVISWRLLRIIRAERRFFSTVYAANIDSWLHRYRFRPKDVD